MRNHAQIMPRHETMSSHSVPTASCCSCLAPTSTEFTPSLTRCVRLLHRSRYICIRMNPENEATGYDLERSASGATQCPPVVGR